MFLAGILEPLIGNSSNHALLLHCSANSPTLAVAASKLDVYQMLGVQFELVMMGGKIAWNM
jgi:hypothetical protein